MNQNTRRILFFAAVLILMSLSLPVNINTYDEGIPVYGAQRVLNGDIPYLDFWTIYPPAMFYFLAGVFKLFGTEILAERAAIMLVNFSTLLIFFNLIKRIAGEKHAWLPVAAGAVLFAHYNLFGRSMSVAILLVALSAYFLFNYFTDKNKKWLFFAGLMIGVCVFFRHDSAAYIYGTEFWAVFFSGMAFSRQAKKSRKALEGLQNAIFVFTTAVITVVIPVFVFMMFHIPLSDIYSQLLEFPLGDFREYRSLPFPNPIAPVFDNEGPANLAANVWAGSVFYLPLLIYISTVIFIIYRVKKKYYNTTDLLFWKEITIFNIGINLFNHAMVRSEVEHALPAVLFSLILIPVIFYITRKKSASVSLLAFLILFVMSIPGIKILRDNYKYYITDRTEWFALERAAGIKADKEFSLNYQEAISRLKSLTEPGEYVFIGNNRHDIIETNDVMAYFLADRPAGTKYHELHPGVATEAGVQQEIIADLERNNVRVIMLVEHEFDVSKDYPQGDLLLDYYLRENFTLKEKIGRYGIYTRKDF
ncbi:MAG: ArnT family glycosyltransferase [Bacteroidota bacterium]